MERERDRVEAIGRAIYKTRMHSVGGATVSSSSVGKQRDIFVRLYKYFFIRFAGANLISAKIFVLHREREHSTNVG